MNPILECAIHAAKTAGASIRAATAQLDQLTIEQKSGFDYVTRVDRESELQIRSIVNQRFPEHAFLGEEFGTLQNEVEDEYQWIVDPLDGTTNFLRRIPHYAVSIAVRKNKVLEYAVVYDIAKDELFYASRGNGLFINDSLWQPQHKSEYEGALLATGVPFSGQNLAELAAFQSTMSTLLAAGTSGIRRLGSAALDLAYVAAGRYDGFWEAFLKPWDIAAGVLLAQEAGCLVTDFDGDNQYMETGDVVVAGPGVHPQMLAAARQNYQRD